MNEISTTVVITATIKTEIFFIQWFNNKYIFLVYRIILFVYCTFWSIYGGLVLIKDFPQPYLFLSNWGDWTLTLYFAWSLGVTLYGVISDSCIEAGEDNCGCSWNKLNRGNKNKIMVVAAHFKLVNS